MLISVLWRTEMDFLVVNDFILKKTDQPDWKTGQNGWTNLKWINNEIE